MLTKIKGGNNLEKHTNFLYTKTNYVDDIIVIIVLNHDIYRAKRTKHCTLLFLLPLELETGNASGSFHFFKECFGSEMLVPSHSFAQPLLPFLSHLQRPLLPPLSFPPLPQCLKALHR